MTAIAITDARWGIAKEGRQVFHIPEDLAFFRAQTLGNVVVMGRKTLGALPGGMPLAGRTNIILTHGGGEGLPAGCIPARLESLPDILRPYDGGQIFVAGGGEVYSELVPWCERALITRVFADGNADTFFPSLDEKNEWKITEKSAIKTFNSLRFQFLEYCKN